MNGVSKITITDDVALITINKAPASVRLLASILGDFADTGINIDMISHAAPQGQYTSLSFSILSDDLVKALNLTAKFADSHPTIKPLVSNGNCKIQLYGDEMADMPGVAAAAMKAVAAADVDISIITTSSVDISILVANADKNSTVAALQKQFGL